MEVGGALARSRSSSCTSCAWTCSFGAARANSRKSPKKREAAAEALRQNRQRLANLERAGTVAQLSALFAHEVKQPITAIVNYLTGIRMLRAQGRTREREEKALGLALKAAYRAADIVERVRRTAKL